MNSIFYFYRKKKYLLTKTKVYLFVIFAFSAILIVINLPLFILDNSKSFLDNDYKFILPMIIFNLSNFFLGISIILHLLTFFLFDKTIINLDIPSQTDSRKGNVLLGRILKGKVKRQRFFLSIKDLEKHMFICGATGTGKSNFLQNFLINFTKYHKIPFFLVEFKGEYHFLQKEIKDVLILWPGENFSLNIFNPKNSNPIIHAERIFDILKTGQLLEESSEYSPQMEKVIVDILTKVCQSKNYQNWKGFEYYCREYLKKNEENIPMLRQTLIGIKNRIRRFSTGPLISIFEEKNEIDINELFKRNIILDFSSIIRLGGEKEDALFLLNMILKYLWDKNLSKRAYNFNGIKHITIIEDAQYFAPQNLMRKKKLTTYLEDIALLQRGTGECLITLATRPDISKEILANNGIVLTFKNHIEKDIMCELLNLDTEKKHYLSILDEGQCIIRINSIKEPFLLKIPLVKHEALSTSEISKNNAIMLASTQGNFDLIPKIKQRKICSSFIRIYKNFILIFKTNKNKKVGVHSKSHRSDELANKNLNAHTLTRNLEHNSFEDLKLYISDLYNRQFKKE
ncbi:MAG: ATP-binding protein [Promethearchaeota archaeon]